MKAENPAPKITWYGACRWSIAFCSTGQKKVRMNKMNKLVENAPTPIPTSVMLDQTIPIPIEHIPHKASQHATSKRFLIKIM